MRAEADSELQALLDADQADRRAGPANGLARRDDERRKRVDELLAEGRARTGEDFFAAAMVFQHGRSRSSYRRAHELAKRGVELGCERAKWLVAASLDRWLMSGGLPQRYGTQLRPEAGRWALWPVDPVTTDEERAVLNVPSLEDARLRAEDMTRRSPPRWKGGPGGIVGPDRPIATGPATEGPAAG